MSRVIFFGEQMDYVIFDLEWNNAYDYKEKKGVNEIIEIGAVRLDKDLNISDTFTQLVKPKLSKKLSKRFVDLTSITKEEIAQNGISFEKAMSDFAEWAGTDAVFMSWSNSDLYVLVSNYKRFFGKTNVSFMKRYMDCQKYCQSFIENCKEQISLTHCAERFEIKVEEENLHRALEDCYVAAACFKKVFNEKRAEEMSELCGDDFFGRLAFKPYVITAPVSKEYNFYKEVFSCPCCSEDLKRISDVQLVNNSFKTVFLCKNCNKKFWGFVRVKRLYDGISTSKRITEMSKNKAKKY